MIPKNEFDFKFIKKRKIFIDKKGFLWRGQMQD